MTVTRKLAGAGALAVAGALLLGSLAAMPAPAVGSNNEIKPVKGEYRDFSTEVTFDVVKDPRKVKNPGIGDDPCPGVVFVTYYGKVRIKNNGKFEYEGPATMYTYGDEPFEYIQGTTTVKVKGKFKTKKKAEGTFEVQNCANVAFTATVDG